MTTGDDGVVVVSVDVEASPETVFRFVSDATRMTEWLGAGVEMDAGAFRVRFDRFGTIVEGRVVELDAPRRAVFTWGVASGPQSEAMPPGSTRVVIDLEPIASGTRVTLRHEGLPDEKERRDHEGGWRYYASRLALLGRAAENGPRLERLADAWVAAWSETAPGRRGELLAECFAEDGRFDDEHASVRGRDALGAHVAAVQGLVPGLRLERTGKVQEIRGVLRFGWSIGSPGGGVIASGENVAELGPEGTMTRVVGFANGA